MRYISTRGSAPALDFEGATLTGLASDGGLYVPESWPQLAPDDIADLAGLSYAETAVRILAPFVAGSLGESELRSLCETAYGGFHHQAVTPLVQLDSRNWLLELFHGPTLAFKDVALQLLGQLFERFLTGKDTHLTVIGATSGDTGSAAIEAVAGRDKVDIFMLHPQGRVSDVQRCQMTTVLAPNVHNIAIEGDFDAGQAMVKAMFGDSDFAGRFRLSAVNSINWARIAAQIVYYAYAAVRLGAPGRRIAFSVPTGNFGDVFAGYAAAQMGLPVEQLIVATNVNDILHRALSTGDYSVGTLTPTAAPSMDIQVSSNFERLLFDIYDRDGGAMAQAMQGFESSRKMVLDDNARSKISGLFSSKRIDPDTMALTMRRTAEHCGEIVDPHTAIGLAAAHDSDLPTDVPIVTLATAHPAKFRDAVERATGTRPHLPTHLASLFDREERYDVLPADIEEVKAYIAERATPA
ncbi:MAG: threonine synthase [Sphingomonadaceae bacterium]|nr:threonine synthase [Sphingomonadaceae bacterium]